MGHMGALVPIWQTATPQEAVSKVLGNGTWVIAKADNKSGLSSGDKALIASNLFSAGLGAAAINSLRKPAVDNYKGTLPVGEQGGAPRQAARALERGAQKIANKHPKLKPIVRPAGAPVRAMNRFANMSVKNKRVGGAIVGGGLIAGSAFNAGADLMSARSIAQKNSVSKRDEFTIEARVSKSLDEKRQVFGWASITELNGEPVVDLQGDYVTIEVIEKAAHRYMSESRKGGDMHRRNGEEPHHVADLIESVVITPEKKEALGLPPDSPTGWWVGFQINDEDTWDLVKNGKRPMFSIHGSGRRVDTVI